MKKKNVPVGILLILVICCLAFVAGCSKKGNLPDSSDSSVELSASVTVDSAKQVYEYETVQLVAYAEGTDEAITFFSDNTQVATVDENGLVTGIKEGEARISASAGGSTAICLITVLSSTYAPTLTLSQENVYVECGKSYTVDVAGRWQGQTLEVAECVLQAAEGMSQDVATATFDGGKITVTGEKSGSTAFEVLTTLRGVTVFRSLSVTVFDDSGIFIQASSPFVPAKGAYMISIATDKTANYDSRAVLEFDVYEDGVKVNNPDIEWDTTADYNRDFDADKVGVTESGGIYAITGEKGGQTTLVGKYTSARGVAYVSVAVTVVRASKIIAARTEILETKGNTEISNATLSMASTETVEAVYLQGEDVLKEASSSSFTVDSEKLPDHYTQLGERELTVETDKYTYTLPVYIYTKVIRSAADLKLLALLENDREKTDFGYYILDGDVDCGGSRFSSAAGATNFSAAIGFRGIFEGNDYTISNFSLDQRGFFGHIGSGAVIRNITFDKVTYLGKYRTALLAAQIFDATLENITVNVAGYADYSSNSAYAGLLCSLVMQRTQLTNVTINAQDYDVGSIMGEYVPTGNTYSGCVIKVKSYKLWYGSIGTVPSDVNGLTVVTGA